MRTAAIITISALMVLSSCKTTSIPEDEVPDKIESNSGGQGMPLQVEFLRGEAHNHPLMAVWVEDIQGNYIQTLFIAESIAKGVFAHGDATTGKWMPGEIRRPAALPVWSHSRGVKEADGLYIPTPETAIADTYSGATPPKSFVLNTRLDAPIDDKFYVYFEINQTWDWNEYWTNNKYPDNEEYKTSCQPSLVYRTMIDPEDPKDAYTMELVGRGHYAGEDGKIYTDLETMTTSKNITRSLTLRLNP